jgi:hypothetical protein
MRDLRHWHTVIYPVLAHFRRRRGRLMREFFPSIDRCRVLDVGGSEHFWRFVGIDMPPDQLVILNVSRAETLTPTGAAKYSITLYDGRTIPFRDEEFDLVVCNSPPPRDRAQFARELDRVGRSMFVQTPAREFPVEVHFLLPLMHWLPRRVARKLVPLTPWYWLSRPDAHTVDAYFWGTRLLSRSEFVSLFSRAELVVERFLGFPKSYVAVVGRPTGQEP